MNWETFHHEADVGVRGYGASAAEAFAQAALALTGVVTEPERVLCREHVDFRCEAPDLELLFLDFINAIVYDMATQKRLFSSFSVEINGNRLTSTACGERVDLARHDPAVEIKGATFTELHVKQIAEMLWVAQCVVDV